MARTRREPVSLFNFSFVDILATTIGVIIFIMVMVILNATDRISADHLKEQVDQLQEQVKERQKALQEWSRQTADDIASRKRYQQITQSKADEAAKGLRKLKERQKALEAEARTLDTRAETLRGEVSEMKKHASDAAADLRKRSRRKRVEVNFRVPRLRSTRKKPVVFECDRDKIYLMVFNYKLNERNYSATALWNAALIKRKSRALGETPSRAMMPRSRFRSTLRRASRNTYFINFIVRDNAFGSFRKLRDYVWKKGYDYNWRAHKATASLIAGTGGGGGGEQVQ